LKELLRRRRKKRREKVGRVRDALVEDHQAEFVDGVMMPCHLETCEGEWPA
jgi:hypothetical protein